MKILKELNEELDAFNATLERRKRKLARAAGRAGTAAERHHRG